MTIVVDVANVMGARADGWWRDRAGAALRLCREVISLAERGVAADRMPGALPSPAQWVLILEGRAKDAAVEAAEAAEATEAAGAVAAAGQGAVGAMVRVVAAPGSGDDQIVAEVVSLGDGCLVVTADRVLRRRCEAAGATVTGPGWLLRLL